MRGKELCNIICKALLDTQYNKLEFKELRKLKYSIKREKE